VCAVLIGLLAGAVGRADVFLDVTAVTPGGPGIGTFSGTLGSIAVAGSISGPPAFFFTTTGSGIGDSTIDGSSPQFSYSTVFSPTVSLTDRIGFTYLATAGNLVSLTFSAPITDPVFHIANFDWAAFSFAPTLGLSSLTLLNGNDGPDGDGIDPAFGGPAYSSLLVWDANPSTSDSTPPGGLPPSSGTRSGYASVQLNGTFSSIGFVVDAMGPFSDNGSFTISAVPEPGSLGLIGLGVVGMTIFRRRRSQSRALRNAR
jgi:hypothetical protein